VLVPFIIAVQVVIAETVTEVRAHGNHTTPDATVLELAGDVVGQPPTDALIAAVTDRLTRSGRFTGVEVRKRYRSIDDPNDVVLMIIVDERPGVSAESAGGGRWTRLAAASMWMPVLDYADGYGFTYGARASFVDLVGARTRLSAPFTWGGERRAQVEVERHFERAPVTRIALSAGITRRENPHYQIADTRTEARLRVESAPREWLRVGSTAAVRQVTFGVLDDRVPSIAVDATLDTRVDPAFPRNAVLASVTWERFGFSGPVTTGDVAPARSGSFSRTTTNVQAYAGVIGSTVLAVRGVSVATNDPPPPYEQALLGGASTLRGHDAGYRAGDNLAAASAELRIPLTSPLNIGRVGIKTFADWGTVYPVGSSLTSRRFDRGYGVGVFATATVLTANADVAWSEHGDFKFHFQLGMNIR
jgi:outer membrane protein assembly factor BamA